MCEMGMVWCDDVDDVDVDGMWLVDGVMFDVFLDVFDDVSEDDEGECDDWCGVDVDVGG